MCLILIVGQPNFLGVSKRKSLEDREGFQTKTIQGRFFVKGKKIPGFSLTFSEFPGRADVVVQRNVPLVERKAFLQNK